MSALETPVCARAHTRASDDLLMLTGRGSVRHGQHWAASLLVQRTHFLLVMHQRQAWPLGHGRCEFEGAHNSSELT